jgi:hypothetical protein
MIQTIFLSLVTIVVGIPILSVFVSLSWFWPFQVHLWFHGPPSRIVGMKISCATPLHTRWTGFPKLIQTLFLSLFTIIVGIPLLRVFVSIIRFWPFQVHLWFHGPPSRIVVVKISCGNPLVDPLSRIPQPLPNHLTILVYNRCCNTNFERIWFHQSVLASPRSFVNPVTRFPGSWHENKLWQPPCTPIE